MKDKDVFEWSGNYMYTKSHSFIYLFFLCQHWRAGRNETLPTFSVICCFFHLLSSFKIKHLALPLLWRFARFLLCFLPWVGFQFTQQWTGPIRKVKRLVRKTELLLSGENRRSWIPHVGNVTCSDGEGIWVLRRADGHVMDTATCHFSTTGRGIIALRTHFRRTGGQSVCP